MGKDVIVALDFATGAEALEFLDQFKDRKPFVKVGMELYYAEGPSIIKEIKKRGHKLFLDLKLHDIPNTVRKAMAVLSKLDVDMVNVHAAGTIDMMKAAKEGLTPDDAVLADVKKEMIEYNGFADEKELLANVSEDDIYQSAVSQMAIDFAAANAVEVE